MPSNIGLSEKTILNARRCAKITNKISGHTFLRENDNDHGWEMLYDRANRYPDEFICEYDAQIASEVDKFYKYSEAELRPKTSSELKKIALERGATGENKPELIKNILAAQGAM